MTWWQLNTESERTWKDVVTGTSLTTATEEWGSHENPRSGQAVAGPIYEAKASWIRSANCITHMYYDSSIGTSHAYFLEVLHFRLVLIPYTNKVGASLSMQKRVQQFLRIQHNLQRTRFIFSITAASVSNWCLPKQLRLLAFWSSIC
jgi:hypothetical protein